MWLRLHGSYYLNAVSESLQVGSRLMSFRTSCLSAASQSKFENVETSLFLHFISCALPLAVLLVHSACIYIYCHPRTTCVEKNFSYFISSISQPTAKAKSLESHKALTAFDQLLVSYLNSSANWRTLSKVIDDQFALESALIETASNLESFHHATPKRVPLRGLSFQCLYLAEPL